MKKSLIVRLGIVVALLAVSAMSFAQSEDDAKKQVLEIFKVFKTRDWKGLYQVSTFSAAVKAKITSPEQFAKDVAAGIKQSDPEDNVGKLFNNMSDIMAGGVVIEGPKARVATSCKVAVSGSSVVFFGVATLIKVDGTWKWDLSFSDDPQEVTAKRVQELLGAPGTPYSP